MYVTRVNGKGGHKFEREQGEYVEGGGRKEMGNCCNYIKIRKEKNLKELAL